MHVEYALLLVCIRIHWMHVHIDNAEYAFTYPQHALENVQRIVDTFSTFFFYVSGFKQNKNPLKPVNN